MWEVEAICSVVEFIEDCYWEMVLKLCFRAAQCTVFNQGGSGQLEMKTLRGGHRFWGAWIGRENEMGVLQLG